MTKDDWKTAEKQATELFGHVDLMIDGYKITLRLEPYNSYRNVIMVYINGYFRGNTLFDDCDERRRFYREVSRSLLPSKPPKGIPRKYWDKRRSERTYKSYYPFWTNFTELRRHFVKNNSSIELIRE